MNTLKTKLDNFLNKQITVKTSIEITALVTIVVIGIIIKNPIKVVVISAP